jgi:Na+/proline symporter
MTLVSWLIVIIPMLFILGSAFYSRKYVRDVADYLACGRVAGRYVISVGDLTAGLSVITLVAMCEQNYQTGMAIGFWGAIGTPVAIFMALTGFTVYRFRQTHSLSMGQFLEQRYNRSFRIVAATIRTIAEMVTNAIGPAVAARFFIYFLGLPHKIPFLGYEIPSYGVFVALLLIMALAILWPGGRISLLITDCFQGIISYPIFVIFTVFVLTQISWFNDVTPVMLDRAKGESFLDPMDIATLRDFNLFALIVTMISSVLNRAAWVGNDTTNAGRTPHEQKMANILGAWRNGFSWTMLTLIGIFVIVFMTGSRFALHANDVRIELSKKVAEEVVENPITRGKLVERISTLRPIPHEIGKNAPYSRVNNPDTQFLDTTLTTIRECKTENGNAVFQKFRSLYNQMMMPVMLKSLFSPVLMGLFTLLMIMLLLSTDDGRIFNASSTLIQDVILPLKKKPMSTNEHLWYLKLCSLGTAIFFFVVSLFFAQLDYINMFVTIMCAVWLGGAGPIMVGGLYTRFGTTVGAWCSLIFGSGFSVLGLVCQRNWADHIYPWLDRCGYVQSVGNFLETISRPFHPFVVWTMDPIKFPINSIEIYFMSMVLGIFAYVIGSWITYKEPYNLDRIFHRGKYSDGESFPAEESVWSWKRLYNTIVGITPEYTKGDKVIAWSVVIWSLVYGFGIMFCGVLIWNAFSPLTPEQWSLLFYIGTIPTALIVGSVSTVWFLVGGIIDSVRLFRDLEKRAANPLDDGRVEGHVSLADKARFDEIDRKSCSRTQPQDFSDHEKLGSLPETVVETSKPQVK